MSKTDYLDSQQGQDARNPFNLPDLCYVRIPTAEMGKHIGIVKRGELGYFPAEGMTLEAADRKNTIMKISHAQREAMLHGSMFGWGVPAVNPASPLNVKARALCDEARDVKQERDWIEERARC